MQGSCTRSIAPLALIGCNWDDQRKRARPYLSSSGVRHAPLRAACTPNASAAAAAWRVDQAHQLMRAALKVAPAACLCSPFCLLQIAPSCYANPASCQNIADVTSTRVGPTPNVRTCHQLFQAARSISFLATNYTYADFVAQIGDSRCNGALW